MVTTQSNQAHHRVGSCQGMPARAQAPHRVATTALLPPRLCPRTATPAPRTGFTPACIYRPHWLKHADALQYYCLVWLTHCVGEQNAPHLPGYAWGCSRTSSASACLGMHGDGPNVSSRRRPSILLPGRAHSLRGRAERSALAGVCLGMLPTSPHADALQYYCQVWLTHCVGEQNAPHLPGYAWVCSRTSMASAHADASPWRLNYVIGFGSRPRVGMSGYTTVSSSTSSASAHAEPHTLGACARVWLPPIYTTPKQQLAQSAAAAAGARVPRQRSTAMGPPMAVLRCSTSAV